MKAIIVLLSTVFITGCHKLPVPSTEPSADTVSAQVHTGVSFSFREAVVSEKKGRSDEAAALIQILKAAQLLSSTVADSLSHLANQNLQESNFSIVRHMPQAIVFRTDTLSRTFPYYYTLLIDTLLKQAGQTGYVITITPLQAVPDVENIPSATIGISLHSQSYVQEIRLDSALGMLDEHFYKIVNRILSAQNHPDRFYLIRKIMEYEHENVFYYGTDNKEYALIQLSQPVAMAIHSFPNVLNLSVEDHRQPLDHHILKSIIGLLDSAKFYPPGTDTAAEYARLKKETLYDVRDIFFYSPALRKCFPPFSSHFAQTYTDILHSLKEHSDSLGLVTFIPHQVIAVSDTETEVSIKVNNNIYTATLENSYDRINIEGLLQLINSALNRELTDGNYYLLNNKTSEYCYIFMTEKQVDLVNQLLE